MRTSRQLVNVIGLALFFEPALAAAQPAADPTQDESTESAEAAPAAPLGPSAESTAVSAAPASPPRKEEEATAGAPAPRTGFQMAIRTGVAMPFGAAGANASDAERELAMSDFFGAHVPLTLDIGGKVTPHIFIGGYAGVGLGGVAGTMSDACSRANASCFATSLRIGPQIQFHALPGERFNPWVGYGIGLVRDTVNIGGERPGSATFSGIELAHFMGGLDARLTRNLGIGPFVDFTMGRYSSIEFESGGGSLGGDIKNPTLHYWLALGARIVVLP